MRVWGRTTPRALGVIADSTPSALIISPLATVSRLGPRRGGRRRRDRQGASARPSGGSTAVWAGYWFGKAVLLWLENRELARDLTASVQDVGVLRRGLADATDQERRRLQRDL